MLGLSLVFSKDFRLIFGIRGTDFSRFAYLTLRRLYNHHILINYARYTEYAVSRRIEWEALNFHLGPFTLARKHDEEACTETKKLNNPLSQSGRLLAKLFPIFIHQETSHLVVNWLEMIMWVINQKSQSQSIHSINLFILYVLVLVRPSTVRVSRCTISK